MPSMIKGRAGQFDGYACLMPWRLASARTVMATAPAAIGRVTNVWDPPWSMHRIPTPPVSNSASSD